jgi:hypothetical protein
MNIYNNFAVVVVVVVVAVNRFILLDIHSSVVSITFCYLYSIDFSKNEKIK